MFVDAVENPEFAREHKVTCSDQPRLHLWRQAEPYFLLQGSTSGIFKDSKSLSKQLKAFLKPACPRLNTQAELTAASKNGSVVVGLVPSLSDNAEPAQTFNQAARMLRAGRVAPDIEMAIVYGSDLASAFDPKVARPAMALFQHGNDKATAVSALGTWDAVEIKKWAIIQTLPAVVDSTYTLREKLSETGLPTVQCWAPQTESNAQKLQEMALKYSGQLIFVRMKETDSYMKSEYGWGGRDTESDKTGVLGLGIMRSWDYALSNFKYGYPGYSLDDPQLVEVIMYMVQSGYSVCACCSSSTII